MVRPVWSIAFSSVLYVSVVMCAAPAQAQLGLLGQRQEQGGLEKAADAVPPAYLSHREQQVAGGLHGRPMNDPAYPDGRARGDIHLLRVLQRVPRQAGDESIDVAWIDAGRRAFDVDADGTVEVGEVKALLARLRAKFGEPDGHLGERGLAALREMIRRRDRESGGTDIAVASEERRALLDAVDAQIESKLRRSLGEERPADVSSLREERRRILSAWHNHTRDAAQKERCRELGEMRARLVASLASMAAIEAQLDEDVRKQTSEAKAYRADHETLSAAGTVLDFVGLAGVVRAFVRRSAQLLAKELAQELGEGILTEGVEGAAQSEIRGVEQATERMRRMRERLVRLQHWYGRQMLDLIDEERHHLGSPY